MTKKMETNILDPSFVTLMDVCPIQIHDLVLTGDLQYRKAKVIIKALDNASTQLEYTDIRQLLHIPLDT